MIFQRLETLLETQQDPWETPVKDFVNPDLIPKDGGDWPEEAYQEYRNQKNIWHGSVRRALALGRITPEEARSRGHYEVSGEDWKPLPSILYHATVALSTVLRDGLRTREEQGSHEGTGLGGGPSNFLSLTDSLDTAKVIVSGFREIRSLMAGEISIQDLIRYAKEGKNAKDPYYEDFIRGVEGSYRDMIQGLIDGKVTRRFSSYEFEKFENPSEWEVISKDPFNIIARKTMSSKERSEYLMTAYKYWTAARSQHGGPENPVFAFGSSQHWATLDPEEIGIVQCEPVAEGMQGVYIWAENEWRIPFGDLVRVTGKVQETEYSIWEGKDGEILPAGTLLYHGAPQEHSSSILSTGKLKSRSGNKTNNGLLTEGGLIWFTPIRADAEFWSTAPEAVGGGNREPGKVFTYRTDRDLRLLSYDKKLTKKEADLLSKALKIPAYKSLDKGDLIALAARRAFDFAEDRYGTENGEMAVIWPVILQTLGYDAVRHASGIAIPAEELEVQ